MNSWFLLFLTIGCAFITFDAFRWQQDVKRAPFSTISNLWKGGLSHLSASEKAKIQQRYSSTLFGVGQFCWLFLVITILLAVVTVRTFLQ
jgi:hypothetical protein